MQTSPRCSQSFQEFVSSCVLQPFAQPCSVKCVYIPRFYVKANTAFAGAGVRAHTHRRCAWQSFVCWQLAGADRGTWLLGVGSLENNWDLKQLNAFSSSAIPFSQQVGVVCPVSVRVCHTASCSGKAFLSLEFQATLLRKTHWQHENAHKSSSCERPASKNQFSSIYLAFWSKS